MQSKLLFRWHLFIVSIVFSSTLVLSFPLDALSQTSFVKTAPLTRSQMLQKWDNQKHQEEIHRGIPVRLKIPVIKIDAPLESVGLTTQGAVDVPKNPMNAAWYKLSPRPGNVGNAVITGHIGRWKKGGGSVFDNLHMLKKGEHLFIEDENGVTITFVVRKIQRYDANANTTEVFVSNDEKSHVNLITCDGVWNKISKNYPQRLVIFTDKE